MLNKKEVAKIVGAFLLKGRSDGFVALSFPVVPSISPAFPVGMNIFICLARRYTRPEAFASGGFVID